MIPYCTCPEPMRWFDGDTWWCERCDEELSPDEQQAIHDHELAEKADQMKDSR